VKIQARFAHDRLDHTKDNTTHLVVSLEAPSLNWVEKRPNVAILPVLDLSGSMGGDKLDYAKKSLLKLIEHLQPGDVAGLVTFSNSSRVDVAPQQVTPDLKARLRQVIERLHVEGGTNFAAAMVDAIDLIQNLDLPPRFLHRVILFTDGQPTVGITDLKAILAMLKNKKARATVSAFGYGEVGGGTWGGCDQSFLSELASLGEGNYAYVRDPDDALAAFGKELGGLLSTYATNLHLEIEPVSGHQIKSVVTNVEHEQDVTGTVEIPIPNILSEETLHFVMEVSLGQQKNSFPRAFTVFNVRLIYSVMTEKGSNESKQLEAKAKVRFVKSEEAQTEAHKEVDSIVALAQMVRAQLEAEKKADAGLFQQAAAVMHNFSEDLQRRGRVEVAHVARNIGGYMMPGVYAETAGYRTSVARGATRAYSVSALDSQAAQDLLECNVSLNNAAMDGTVQLFTNDESADSGEPRWADSLVRPDTSPVEPDPDNGESGSSVVWTGK